MHWLFLLLALGALVLAFTTPHMWLLVLALLAALPLLLAWVRSWYVQHIGDLQHSGSSVIDPAGLRRLHELAERRNVAMPDNGDNSQS